MLYLSFPVPPSVQETPSPYSAFPRKKQTYEIELKSKPSSGWLKGLGGAHRLVQALLQGELLGQYELLDFLIWPEGLFARVVLEPGVSLGDFLKFIKDKSVPAHGQAMDYWDEEPRRIKLVAPEKLSESARSFLETAGRVRQNLDLSKGLSPNLFFFFRNSRLNP